jgi:hypothetical protein
MATHILRQIRTAVSHLDPGQVRETAERPLRIGLAATSNTTLAAMEDFFAPPDISSGKRAQVLEILERIDDPGAQPGFDIIFAEEGWPEAPGVFTFRADDPGLTVRQVLREREDLSMALARRLPPFHKPVVHRIIRQVSQENSLFALFTALPAVLPNIISLGWAAGEFASDTAVLTVNQIRMAFLIAAASGQPAGYSEQKAQIASIIAGAFGWRAVARELAGHIPFGGGLVPKAAVAYAGTFVVGLSLERYYRIGHGLTAAERRAAYREALDSGKRFARVALEERARRS